MPTLGAHAHTPCQHGLRAPPLSLPGLQPYPALSLAGLPACREAKLSVLEWDAGSFCLRVSSLHSFEGEPALRQGATVRGYTLHARMGYMGNCCMACPEQSAARVWGGTVRWGCSCHAPFHAHGR